MERICGACEEVIPLERLEALPETRVCVNCSSERPYRALISGTAKNKGNELIIEKADSDAIRLAEDRGDE